MAPTACPHGFALSQARKREGGDRRRKMANRFSAGKGRFDDDCQTKIPA
jgi:hypothetical protein